MIFYPPLTLVSCCYDLSIVHSNNISFKGLEYKIMYNISIYLGIYLFPLPIASHKGVHKDGFECDYTLIWSIKPRYPIMLLLRNPMSYGVSTLNKQRLRHKPYSLTNSYHLLSMIRLFMFWTLRTHPTEDSFVYSQMPNINFQFFYFPVLDLGWGELGGRPRPLFYEWLTRGPCPSI